MLRSCVLSSFVEFRSAVLEKKSKMWKLMTDGRRTDDGRTTDGSQDLRQRVITIVHLSLRLRCTKNMVPSERSCHRENTYEIWKLYRIAGYFCGYKFLRFGHRIDWINFTDFISAVDGQREIISADPMSGLSKGSFDSIKSRVICHLYMTLNMTCGGKNHLN